MVAWLSLVTAGSATQEKQTETVPLWPFYYSTLEPDGVSESALYVQYAIVTFREKYIMLL